MKLQSDDVIFRHIGDGTKFPELLSVLADDKGNIAIGVRGAEQVMDGNFIEPGHISAVKIPADRVADLIVALMNIIPSAGKAA